MNLNQWKPWYQKIIDKLGYDPSEDRRAAEILNRLMEGRQIVLTELKRCIKNQPTLIFGAGPSLESDIKLIEKTKLFDICRVITANGATTGLLRITNRTPDIIVTDLDGQIEDLKEANRRGAIMVVHAHGDNITQLNRYVKNLKNIFGTTQIEPFGNLYNFGGFTDGDRAVILAVVLGGKPIAMAGMDIGTVSGDYSKKIQSLEIKKVKLRFCKELLEWQAAHSSVKMFNLTGSGEDIMRIMRITPEQFENILLSKNNR